MDPRRRNGGAKPSDVRARRVKIQPPLAKSERPKCHTMEATPGVEAAEQPSPRPLLRERIM